MRPEKSWLEISSPRGTLLGSVLRSAQYSVKSQEGRRPRMPGLDLIEEAGRQLTICNACRYCEGYCAVFPALEVRRDFAKGDVLYLAHLCHDCRACYHACPYTPPHEFAINIPKVMSDVRVASYQRWSWPALLARSFADPRISITLAAFAVALVMILS